jgi:tetratricopeptide (TPR) repeat protein
MRTHGFFLAKVLVICGGVIVAGRLHPWLSPLFMLVALLTLIIYTYQQQVDILVHLNKHRIAQKRLDAQIARNPNNPITYAKRARLHYHTGKFRQSRDDYRQALQLDPAPKLEAIIYTELGQVFFAAGKYAHALKSLQAAYVTKEHTQPTLAWLAIAHYAQRDFAEARIWWQSARREQPGYTRLDGTNWPKLQAGWLTPPPIEAQKITALLNAHE